MENSPKFKDFNLVDVYSDKAGPICITSARHMRAAAHQYGSRAGTVTPQLASPHRISLVPRDYERQNKEENHLLLSLIDVNGLCASIPCITSRIQNSWKRGYVAITPDY